MTEGSSARRGRRELSRDSILFRLRPFEGPRSWSAGSRTDRHTRWVPRVRATDLQQGQRFRLLAPWSDDDGGTIDQITSLVALEVLSDGPWIRIRLEDGRTVSLEREDMLAVDD
jgi:hypothetical protein